MQSFHYHHETGEFLGQSSAMPDPLEEGRFLVPAYATDAPPPESVQNRVAVFDGQSWGLKPDFRGIVYWLSHGDNHTISEIGETVPEGAFLEEPEAPDPTTEQLADTARAERDRLIESIRWRIERHSDELALGSEPTEPLEPLLQYTQALRDVPQQAGFPESVEWPQCP